MPLLGVMTFWVGSPLRQLTGLVLSAPDRKLLFGAAAVVLLDVPLRPLGRSGTSGSLCRGHCDTAIAEGSWQDSPPLSIPGLLSLCS